MISFSILFLALVLRLWAIDFGLPFLYHADEPVVVNHALQYGTGDLNPHFFNIPPLTSYFLFGIYGLLFVFGKLIGIWSSSQAFASAFFHDPSLVYLMGRIFLGVLPSVLAVSLFMVWLRRLGYSVGWQRLGGVMFATCFILVSDAHYIYADMLLILTLLCFFFLLHSLDLLRFQSHIILGAVIGLAAAIKYNGVFIAIPYIWMLARVQMIKPIQFIQWSFWAGVASIIVFICCNPYALLDYALFIRELNEQSHSNQGVAFMHHWSYSLVEGIGWPFLILSLIAAIRSFFIHDSKRTAVVIFCIAYYVVLWQKGQPYGRYILPLAPFILFLAVDAARCLVTSVKPWKWLFICILILGFGFNGYKVIRFNWIMSQTDVRTVAKEWIESNIPADSRIALDGTFFTPRLSFSCDQLKNKMDSLEGAQSSSKQMKVEAKLKNCMSRVNYNIFYLSSDPGSNPFLFASPEIADNVQALKDNNIEYAVITSNEALKAIIQSKGELIQTWNPYKDDVQKHSPYDSQIITGGPFTLRDLMKRKTNGYPIELYKLDF